MDDIRSKPLFFVLIRSLHTYNIRAQKEEGASRFTVDFSMNKLIIVDEL